jgi:hypothetical protein
MINFNEFLPLNTIQAIYRRDINPDSLCYLWNHENGDNLLITEAKLVTQTESERSIELDERTKFIVH